MRLLSLGSCSRVEGEGGADAGAVQSRDRLQNTGAVLDCGDTVKFLLERFGAGLLDALLVHTAGVEGADLAFDAVLRGAAQLVVFGGVFEDFMQHVVIAVVHEVEHGEGGAIRGDGGRGQPFAVGELVEVLIRLDGRVHAGQVDAGVRRVGEPGRRPPGVAASATAAQRIGERVKKG